MAILEAHPAIDPQKLDKLAEVAVHVGLNLQEGQDLVLTAPLEAMPLVRRVAAVAYRAGAGLVTPLVHDEQVVLARFAHGNDASFDRAANWLFNGMAEAYDNNAARMNISGENPGLLAGQDPEKISRIGKANSIAGRPAMERITGFNINWSIVAYPTVAWARKVFPDVDEAAAVGQLAEAIFAASRVNEVYPVAAWAEHDARLHARKDWMNQHNFQALHFKGPGTDLTVGLAEGHSWNGGSSMAKNGVACNPNIPTEEVFTTPHAQRVDGTVRASKPLVHQGTLIDGIEARFEAGRIVEVTCGSGQDVFRKLIDTDEGAARLGEVALVPFRSPISDTGVLFFNTLFDENAACHIAQGQCYSECFVEGVSGDKDKMAAAGGNESLIHVDWMIGGPGTEIDGIKADGTRVPVFRDGGWAA